MINQPIGRIIAHRGKFYAEFCPGGHSATCGSAYANGIGHTRDKAVLECLHDAESEFGYHGGVIFLDVIGHPHRKRRT